MTHRWIITALGKDRPGIVAGVAKVLYGLGCNLEDSAMTRLEGEFAIMLIFESPPRVTVTALRRAFEPLRRRLRLTVHLKPLTKPEASTPPRRGKAYLISVYGADRPGIVFRVAEGLANAGINITDVETHRSEQPMSATRPPLYMMLLEVEVPQRLSVAVLQRKLERLARSLGVEVSLRPVGAEIL